MSKDAQHTKLHTDETPWALNFVVRAEKDAVVCHDDAVLAAARATVLLLDDPRAEDQWKPSIDSWTDGRIRKLCRRASGTRFEATRSFEHVEVTIGSAQVRAFVPCLVTEQPHDIAKLQLSGTEFARRDRDYVDVEELSNTLVVFENPGVDVTSAKWAVQVAHGAQLASRRHKADPERYAHWVAAGMPMVLVRPSAKEWEALVIAGEGLTTVFIRDAGFTEVEPNTLTTIARYV